MDRSKFDEMMAKSGPFAQMYTEAEMEALVKQAKEELEQATAPRMQFGFDVVEVQRVGLQPGDILMVTVKNDDLSQDSVDSLRNQLQAVFPNNKVFVFAMGTSDDVQLKIINDSNPLAIQSNPGYCSDCDCGKKATSEAEDEHMKNLAKQAGDSNG